VRALGILGRDESVRARAADLFDKLGSDVTAVDPDVAGAVVAVAAHSGGEAAYTEFQRRWREAPTPQEELRYLYGLGGFEHLALVQRTLDLTLDEVRSQNAPFLVSTLLQNRVGGETAWQFVEQHWDALLRRFPEPLLDRMLEGIVVHTTPEAAARIRAFLETNPLPGRAKQIAQLLERLEVNVAFRQRLAATR
jgi:puromycin-sensitive aminopeptidase